MCGAEPVSPKDVHARVGSVDDVDVAAVVDPDVVGLDDGRTALFTLDRRVTVWGSAWESPPWRTFQVIWLVATGWHGLDGGAQSRDRMLRVGPLVPRPCAAT
jgi:hypothetical protein